MLKFRTMNYKREKTFLSRLLRSTALDELPQLINILKADMSFVGPRPLIPQEACLTEELSLRALIRPGLTGIAQIAVSKNASLLEKSRYDIEYISIQNIGLDITIILRSFWSSLRRKWDSVKAIK